MRRKFRMWQNNSFMTVHDALVNIKKKWPDVNPPNPFPENFTIFEYLTVDGNRFDTLGLTVNNLWSIFNQWYASMCIAKKVPPIGYEYLWRATLYTVEDVGDQAVYVWRCLDDMVGWYCNANRNRWEHILLADAQKYDPITNYNMSEYAGSSSKSSGMTNTPGTVTTTNEVFPFDLNSGTTGKPESKSTTGYNASTSGYTDANQQFDNTDNPWKDNITTPKGNTTSISKLIRSGNIGVTTSQQMIASEYELRQFNTVQEFMNEVCKYSLIADWDSMLNNQY